MSLRDRCLEVSQAEPLTREILGEGLAHGMLQHPLDLLAQRVVLAQFAFSCECGKGIVRGGTPKKVRKPSGEVEVTEFARRRGEVKEIRAAQDGFQTEAKRSFERLALVEPRLHQSE